jgi:hypothetical protein
LRVSAASGVTDETALRCAAFPFTDGCVLSRIGQRPPDAAPFVRPSHAMDKMSFTWTELRLSRLAFVFPLTAVRGAGELPAIDFGPFLNGDA